MEWKDPPPAAPPGRKKGAQAWREEAIELKLNPGRWALIKSCDDVRRARNLAHAIKRGLLASFRPEGVFEATSRQEGDDFNVYARYAEEEWGR